MIKFWSYKREYKKHKNTITKLVNKTLNSGVIFFGKNLINFEKNFLKKNKSKYEATGLVKGKCKVLKN